MVSAPIIIDIVGSRTIADRAALHEQILSIFDRVESALPSRVPLWATVGDEFQIVYDSLDHAIAATALARLLSTGDVDLRFGIGLGEIRTIASGTRGPIDDGPGWYHAREALDELTRLQSHGHPWLRTWVSIDDAAYDHCPQLARALLTSRDHTISRMGIKDKRMTAAWLMGATQQEIAREEKMSQAAISQRLETSGGTAILHVTNILNVESP